MTGQPPTRWVLKDSPHGPIVVEAKPNGRPDPQPPKGHALWPTEPHKENVMQPTQVRSLDDSIRHAHDAAGRIESTLASLHGDLTGEYSTAETDVCRPGLPSGLIFSADTLAGRLEILTRTVADIRDRVVTSNIVSVGQGGAGRSDFGSNSARG